MEKKKLVKCKDGWGCLTARLFFDEILFFLSVCLFCFVLFCLAVSWIDR